MECSTEHYVRQRLVLRFCALLTRSSIKADCALLQQLLKLCDWHAHMLTNIVEERLPDSEGVRLALYPLSAALRAPAVAQGRVLVLLLLLYLYHYCYCCC
jgi:hypothetical protein